MKTDPKIPPYGTRLPFRGENAARTVGRDLRAGFAG